MTASTPDVKEVYGKMKKEEKASSDQKSSDGKSSPKKKAVAVKFNNVAFLEEHGDRFWFFKTHVIPGKTGIICALVIILFECHLRISVYTDLISFEYHFLCNQVKKSSLD